MTLVGYKRAAAGTQPAYLHPPYQTSVKRAPSRPLILLPHTLSEVTGPVFGHERIGPNDNDLTKQHAGEPIGERIILSGRVLDEDGRRSEEHTSELQSRENLVCRLLPEQKKHEPSDRAPPQLVLLRPRPPPPRPAPLPTRRSSDLILLPHTLSEVTGPVFGHERIGPNDNDLTKQHAGEPIGERIILSGRVLDEDGR